MQDSEKRSAKADYKERKTVAGIYAARCDATGEVWVGQAANLETVRNRLWFSLRSGTHPRRPLQQAWKTHGADNFSFEVLEELEDEELPYIRAARLKERLGHWQQVLAAALV